MLRHIAILKVEDTKSARAPSYFRSPICTTKPEARQWQRDQLRKYPSRRVNSKKKDKRYYIETYLISYETRTSENVELFFADFIPS